MGTWAPSSIRAPGIMREMPRRLALDGDFAAPSIPGLTRPFSSVSSPSSLPIPRARLLSRFASSTSSALCYFAAERLRCVKAVFRTLGRGYSLLSCIYPYILFFLSFYEHAFWHYTLAVDASALFRFTLLSLEDPKAFISAVTSSATH